jgi:O-antigen ligase
MLNFKKIIEYGIYLLVFLLPLQTRLFIRQGELKGIYSEYLTISLYAVDILLVVLLILFSIFKIKNSKPGDFKNSTIWIIIGVFEFFVFISVLFADDRVLAFYKYGVFLLGVGLFWLLISASYDFIKLLLSFFLGIFFQASLGIWQFISQSSFASKWLGIALHNPAQPGVSVIETIGADGIGERWLRAYGGLDHPNILGGLMVIGLLLIFSLSNKKTDKIKKIYKGGIFYYFIIFIFILSLFFSFSRASWLAFGAGILIIIIFTFLEKDWLKQKSLLEIILASSLLIIIPFFTYQNLVDTRLYANERLEQKSINERTVYLNEAQLIVKENWFVGTGIGNYTLNIKEDEKNPYDYQPVHNVFLLILAEAGFFGFASFLALIFYFAYLGVKNTKNYLVFPLLFALVLIMLFDHWLWSFHFGIFLFWFCFGIMFRTLSKKCY